MREPRNTQNTRKNGEVESGGVWSGGVETLRHGEEWFGDVPSDWYIGKMRSVVSERREKFNRNEELIILSLLKDVGIIPYSEKGDVGNKSKEDHSQYKVARKGDLVINSMNVIIGSVGISPYDGYISPAYYSFVPRENVCMGFIGYLCSTRRFQKAVRCYAKGIMEIRLRVSSYDFLSMPIPLPPLSEQRAIVKYLDAETGRIDRAIAAEEKMIALLQERREILINEAVGGQCGSEGVGSGGVDFHTEARCARDEVVGLPELSEPEGPQGAARRRGWEVRYGKSIFTENKRKNKMLENKTILSLSYGKIIVKSSPDSGLVPAEYSGYQLLSPGDIVIRCTDLQNDQKSQRIGFVEVGGIITSAYLGLKVNDGINSRYIAYWLKNWDATKEIYRYGSGLRQSLSWVDLKYLPIPLPPLSEQEEIVKYLDVETGRIDRAIEVKRRQIELLRERRQIVIDEVVTGKVRVA